MGESQERAFPGSGMGKEVRIKHSCWGGLPVTQPCDCAHGVGEVWRILQPVLCLFYVHRRRALKEGDGSCRGMTDKRDFAWGYKSC